MRRLVVRLLTFLLVAALNGAFARAEDVAQIKPDVPREQVVATVVLPSRVEVMALDALEPKAVITLSPPESGLEFIAVKYTFFPLAITTKHRARAPPTH
jgi:hypothetical protein